MDYQDCTLLHELLQKIAQVQTKEQLDAVMQAFMEQMNEYDGTPMQDVFRDICVIGETLAALRSEDGIDSVSRRIASLSEQERAELAETERILAENNLNYHYQPIVNTVDGEIYSYEALMRPKSKICPSPYHVMKYASITKRLDDIEAATFRNVLHIIDSQTELFHGKRIFINSIPGTVLSAEDAEYVNALLEKYAERVVVEITEHAEVADAAFHSLKEMYQRMGVRTAIDDYGTGYSNVQNILRYMPDYVKIDRSLLSDIHNNQKKRHFVREIIEFCHSNHILALAEGVETTEELRTVIRLGADLVQGYYTARPAPDVIETIPLEIRQEIRHYHQEREDRKALHIYTAEPTERVLLDRLAKEDYRCLLIGTKGSGNITVTSESAMETKMRLEIQNGFCGTVYLDNVEIASEHSRPCIEIGEHCDVRLELGGNNYLKHGGIRVAPSAKLTLCGSGRLSVSVDGSCSYAIGNDADSAHGELIFEQGVSIENNAAAGVCIGSGKGGKISIREGQFILYMTTAYGVGIGSLNADTDLVLSNCDIAINLSAQTGAAIGSLNGNCRVTSEHASIKTYLSGNDLVGIGTTTGQHADVSISEAHVVFNILADQCTAIGSLQGDTRFNLERAGMHIFSEGTRALALGSLHGDTQTHLTNAELEVGLNASEEYVRDIRLDTIQMTGGRAKFVINNKEFLL